MFKLIAALLIFVAGGYVEYRFGSFINPVATKLGGIFKKKTPPAA